MPATSIAPPPGENPFADLAPRLEQPPGENPFADLTKPAAPVALVKPPGDNPFADLIPPDVRTPQGVSMPEFEAASDHFSNPLKALRAGGKFAAAAVADTMGSAGNMEALAHDPLDAPLPAERELAAIKGAGATATRVGLGVVRQAPSMGAAMALSPVISPYAAFPLVFGGQTYSETGDIKQAGASAAGALLFPLIGKIMAPIGAQAGKALVDAGLIDAGNITAQKAVEAAVHQTAFQVATHLEAAGDYWYGTPEERLNKFVEVTTGNLLYAIPALINVARGDIPSETQRILGKMVRNEAAKFWMPEASTPAETARKAKAGGEFSPEARVVFAGVDPEVAGTTPEKAAEFARSMGLNWKPAAPKAAEPTPVPEQPSTIAAQAALTRDPASAKSVTLVTPGAVVPDNHGLTVVPTSKGTLLVNPDKVDPAEAAKAIEAGTGGQLMGMSTPAKPDGATHVVQTKDKSGNVVQDEVVNPETMHAAVVAGSAVAPGGTTAVKPPEQVLSERQGTPSQQIDRMANLSTKDFVAETKGMAGGMTEAAYALGQSVTTPDEIAKLERAREQAKGAAKVHIDAGDFDGAIAEGTRSQFFSEAHGAATGTGSAGEHLAKTNPDYKPPFPVVKEAPSETVPPTNVAPVTPPTQTPPKPVEQVPAAGEVVPVKAPPATPAARLTESTITTLADSLKVKWDNDPAFMAWTAALTGKAHLSELDEAGLAKVRDALVKGERPTNKLTDRTEHGSVNATMNQTQITKPVPIGVDVVDQLGAKDSGFVIAVGEGGKRFTLWHAHVLPTGVRKYYFVQNLGKTKESALANVDAAVATLSARGYYQPFGYGNQIALEPPVKVAKGRIVDVKALDPDADANPVVKFGKHAGTPVRDIPAKDIGWAMWAVNTFGSSPDPKKKALATALMQDEAVQAKMAEQTTGLSTAADKIDGYNTRLTPFNLTAKIEGTDIAINGETYNIRDQLKAHNAKWNQDGKVWAFRNPADLERFITAVEQRAGTTAGRLTGDVGSGETGARLARLRDEVSGLPDRSVLEGGVGRYIGADTAGFLRAGEAHGIPSDIIGEQIEDAARIVSAREHGSPMIILASEPGSGKTFVLGAAAREVTKRGAEKIVYVTMNAGLITQIKRDLAAYGTDNIRFVTYAELRELKPEASDVIMFDEAHNIKNAESQQGKSAQKWIAASKFTVFASATPFENPTEAGYMNATGVFGHFGSFKDFALAYGATRKMVGPKDDKVEIIYWQRNKNSNANQVAAREFFRQQGMMLQRNIRIDPKLTTVVMHKMQAAPKWADLYQNLTAAINKAAPMKTEDGDGKFLGYDAAWIVNLQKRILEASKVQEGIRLAKEAHAKGRSVVLFVETKAERKIDIPDLINRHEEWQMAVEAARAQKERPPAAKEFGALSTPLTELLRTLMQDTGQEIIEIEPAEELIKTAMGDKNVAIYTGSVTDAKAQANLATWRAKKAWLLVATMAKGGTGLSLHDTVGDRQTDQININMPWKATGVKQVGGRTLRYGIKSPTTTTWIFANNIPFDQALAGRVGGRMQDMGALVQGADNLKLARNIAEWNFEDEAVTEGPTTPLVPPTPEPLRAKNAQTEQNLPPANLTPTDKAAADAVGLTITEPPSRRNPTIDVQATPVPTPPTPVPATSAEMKPVARQLNPKSPLTPMMQQYQRIKAQLVAEGHDALLAFRLGDFYEFFFEDAVTASKQLRLALTRRNDVPMAGIPYHAAKSYFEKLVAAGMKVAVVDTDAVPNPGQLADRKVTEILGESNPEVAPVTQAERALGESLAKKYGVPVFPVNSATEPYESIARFSNMLERAADKSKDESELAQILDASKGKPEESRIAWAVANNPHSTADTFAKAKANYESLGMASDEAIASLVPRRAELRKARGLDVPPTPVTPSTPIPVGKQPELGKPGEFSPKVAKEQKKFLLSAIDTAIGEALDERPKVEADADKKAVDDIVGRTAGETLDTHTQRQIAVLEPLFEKYHIPTDQEALPAAPSLDPKNPIHQAVEAKPMTRDQRWSLLVPEINRAIFDQLPKVVIQVPGDGQFTIVNTKTALKAFKEQAADFPTTQVKQKMPTFARQTASAPAAKSKMNDDSVTAALEPVVSTEAGRHVITFIWSDGKQSVATNGRMLTIIQHGLGGTVKKPVMIKDGKSIPVGDEASVNKYPDYTQVMPKDLPNKSGPIDTAIFFNILKQASEVTSDKSNSVKLHFYKDGTIGVTASAPDVGEYRHNIVPDKPVVKMVALDPEYLINAINAARKVGDDKVVIHYNDELSPISVESKSTKSIIMPMRLSMMERRALSDDELLQSNLNPQQWQKYGVTHDQQDETLVRMLGELYAGYYNDPDYLRGGLAPIKGQDLAPLLGQGLSRVVDVATLLGKRVVFFTNLTGKRGSQGSVSPAIPNVIFIRGDTPNPHLMIFGHELMHRIAIEHPDIYKWLVEQLRPDIQNFPAFRAAREREGYTGTLAIEEELMGDLLGDRFMEPEFWERLAEKNPSFFRRIADMIKGWLDKVLQFFKSRNLQSDKFVKDIAKAREVLAEVVDRYARRQGGGAEPMSAELKNAVERQDVSGGAWIAPDGTVHPVRMYEHDFVAKRILGSSYDPQKGGAEYALMKTGYARAAMDRTSNTLFVDKYDALTNAQKREIKNIGIERNLNVVFGKDTSRSGGGRLEQIHSADESMLRNMEDRDEAPAEPAVDDGWVPTMVHGQKVMVKGKEGLPPGWQATSIQFAQDLLAKAGVPATLETFTDTDKQEKSLFYLNKTGTDQRAAFEKLADLVEEAIRTHPSFDPKLSMIQSTLRLNYLRPGSAIEDLPQPLRYRLFNMAQAEASAWGAAGRAMQGFKDDLLHVGRHVDLYIRRILDERFGGKEIASIMRQIMVHFRDYFTDEQIKGVTDKVPDLQRTLDALIDAKRKDQGSMVYRLAHAELGPKALKSLKALEASAEGREAVEHIIAIARANGVPVKPNPNKPLPPIELLKHMANEATVAGLDQAIQDAVVEAQRNAARVIIVRDKSLSDEELAAYDAKTLKPELEGPDPSDEEIEAGLLIPKHAHWKVIRDNLLGYNPVTVKLVQKVLANDFKGTKFAKPGLPPPVPVKIDLVALAKSPDAEVQRVFDAYLANIEANLDVGGATPAMKLRIHNMIRSTLIEQLQARKKDFIESYFEPKKSVPVTASTKAQQLINAGLDAKDDRLKSDKFKQLIKRVTGPYLAGTDFPALATSERSVKKTWIADKLAEITKAEAAIFAGSDPATNDYLTAVVYTHLAERLQAAEEAIARSFLAGKDVTIGPPATLDPLAQERRTADAVAKLAGIIRAGGIDQTMVDAVAKKAAVQKLLPTIGSLVKEALSTPFYRQHEIMDRVVDTIADMVDIDPALKDKLRATLVAAFEPKFAEARRRARETTFNALKGKEKVVATARRSTWQKIERFNDAGNFDDTNVMKEIAKSHGVRIPDDDEVVGMRDLVEQIQRLSELTPRQITDAAGNPAALARAQDAREEATRDERNQRFKKLSAGWASMMKPIGLTNPGNTMRFLTELAGGNLLTRTGFFTRQIQQITTDFASHLVTRPLGMAFERFNVTGDRTALLEDVGAVYAGAIKATIKAFKEAMLETVEASPLRSRGKIRNVDSMMSGIAALERVSAQADKLDAAGHPYQALALRAVNLVSIGYKMAAMLDRLHGVPSEYIEMRNQVVLELRKLGATRAEAETHADAVMEGIKADYMVALAEVQRIALESGLTLDKLQLWSAARRVARRWAYERMRALGLKSDELRAQNDFLAETLGWNVREVRGPGGWVGGAVKGAGRLTKLPIGLFGNAIAIGINRAIERTPLYAVTTWNAGMGSEENPRFKTETDKQQRRVEAALYSLLGATIFGLVMAGVLRVNRKWPLDKEERDLFEASGRRPGTAEEIGADGKIKSVWSLTVGPMANVAPYAAGAGALRDYLDGKKKEQDKLDAEAAKQGLVPGKAKGATVGDIVGVVGAAAEQSILGGRTAAGLIGSISDYGTANPTKFLASQVSPYIPLLPQLQEFSRMEGVNLDAKLATFSDFMLPMPTSPARRINMLGDPVQTPNDFQRMFQVLSGGNYPFAVDEAPASATAAYQALVTSGYRPPSINPNQGYAIGNDFRPLTNQELQDYTQKRGTFFKEELASLGPEPTKQEAQAAYRSARDQALSAVGVAVPVRQSPAATAGTVGTPAPVMTSAGMAGGMAPRSSGSRVGRFRGAGGRSFRRMSVGRGMGRLRPLAARRPKKYSSFRRMARRK